MKKETSNQEKALTPLQRKGFTFVHELQEQNEQLTAQIEHLQNQVHLLSRFTEQLVLLLPPVLAQLGEPQGREAMCSLVGQIDKTLQQGGVFFADEAFWEQLNELAGQHFPNADDEVNPAP